MKRFWILISLSMAALVTACQNPTTPRQLPGTKTEVLTLTATKTYNPSTIYADGSQPIDADTIITLPTSIGVTAGHGTGGTVALSFDGGTVDTLNGIRCYFVSNADGTSYEFSSCDGGAGGGGVLPYYSAGDAVQLLAGDTLVLRVMSGDNSTPTSVSVSIAAILKD